MLYSRILLILSLLFLFIGCSQTDKATSGLTMQSFTDQYNQIVNDDEAIKLCRKYMAESDDLELVRHAQWAYYQINADDARRYTQEIYKDRPNSDTGLYLYARILDTLPRIIDVGRELIKKRPDWIMGYRLFVGAYYNTYVMVYDTVSQDNPLARSLPKEADFISEYIRPATISGKFLQESPSFDSYLRKFLLRYYLITAKPQEAFDLLNTLEKDSTAPKISSIEWALVYIGLGRQKEAISKIKKEVSYLYEVGWLEDSSKYDFSVNEYTIRLYNYLHDYDGLVRYLTGLKNYKKDPYILYNLACSYALQKEPGKAFYSLNLAVDQGLDKYIAATMKPEFGSLKDDPRWDDLIERMKVNWENTAPMRLKKYRSEVVNDTAPELNIRNDMGQVVNLQELRGKKAALFFWAYYCQTCGDILGEINEFANKGQLMVVAISVWDFRRDELRRFANERGFQAPIYFGNDDLAENYKITGLPGLVLIDENGIIKHRNIGQIQGIGEILRWWADGSL